MDFLWNKQILGILFILKINFCIYLPILYVIWIELQLNQNTGGLV
jgi:hypothetical protein